MLIAISFLAITRLIAISVRPMAIPLISDAREAPSANYECFAGALLDADTHIVYAGNYCRY